MRVSVPPSEPGSLPSSYGPKSFSDHAGARRCESPNGNLVSLPEDFQLVVTHVPTTEVSAVGYPRLMQLLERCKDGGILAQDLYAGHCKPMATQVPCIDFALLTEYRFLPCAVPEVFRQGDKLCTLFQ
jgi:hypothetical protein